MAYQRTHNLFGSHFCGITMRQYWADLALWELFLNEHKDIRGIIEMGAFHGGMTLFLGVQAAARNMQFLSIDRDWPRGLDTPLAQTLRLPSKFLRGDFWEEMHGAFLYYLNNLEYKPVLLFVDGGCKREEFKAFVPELTPGDYVGVHDYGTEFKPEDVDPVIHLLEPVFLEECLLPPQPCLTRFWRRIAEEKA